jgi:hypothetical protein
VLSDELLLLDADVAPFVPAPRTYAGNMCGVRVPGLPPIAGGAADPSLVLSWFYDRYGPADQARIRAAWAERRDLDVLLSWPDSRAIGRTPPQFAATCAALIGQGFRPCVFLCSKDYDPPDVPVIEARMAEVLPLLIGLVPRICVGWELSIWLSPTQVQTLIDWLAPLVNGYGGKLYVHFQVWYFAFQQPGHVTADFWWSNVGKLAGILHQSDTRYPKPEFQARLKDCLDRFAGGFGYPADSGFGHPFDCIACEITAQEQFNGQMSEADGDYWGQWALATPATVGPFGPVAIMGSGNGHTQGA